MPKGYVPAIFISSTCFDLGQLRADLAEFAKSMGLDPILSEHANFPVDPSYDAIKNCLETVKARADIFVLVIGARNGQPPRNGKSVTNLEYMEARAKGIPVYVFVSKPILNILEVWRKSPAGDYTGVVDSPLLFEFVESLRSNTEHWVFGFEGAQDITNTLRVQLAYLFMDGLVSRARIKSVAIPADLQSLAPRALEILLQKPTGWEYLLFVEVFRDCVRAMKHRRYDYKYGVNLTSSIGIPELGSLLNWLSTHIEGILRVVGSLTKLLNEALPVALGQPGMPGDASHLVYIANRMGSAYEKAIDWALEFQRIHTDDDFSRLMQLTSCMTKNIVTEIEDFAELIHSQINAALGKELSEGEKVQMELTLTITVPDLTELNEEMDRLRRSLS